METSLERKSIIKYEIPQKGGYIPYTTLSFSEVDKRAKHLARVIESRLEVLTNILLNYESYEVVEDEVHRTLDLLTNLKENKKYFSLRVGAITSFLPRNQPLYAFTCFVIVPSLMASEVHFRIPHSMRHFFSEILSILEIAKLFPNVIISSKQRVEFIKERSALIINPKTKESKPLTDVVIFTGLPSHADKLRMVFDRRTLFITNGAGHNPVIVSKDADLAKAVNAVTTLQFYNQGQDCAAPNAILVHRSILPDFLNLLRKTIRNIKIGQYQNRSCRIGPISDPEDLTRIQDILVKNKEWLDFSTSGVIRTRESIVEPTIICKPLIDDGNFSEIFAPIIFIQEYAEDRELALYLEDKHYALNAMYLTLYGTSQYVKNFVGKSFSGKVIHDKNSFLHNTHLHIPGVERGTQPYGGSGYGASNISLDGKITPMATLPQRDIYKWVALPILRKKMAKATSQQHHNFTVIEEKEVDKILRKLQYTGKDRRRDAGVVVKNAYIDTKIITNKNLRYIKIEKESIYNLREIPNVEYIVSLKKEDLRLIHVLNKLLNKRTGLTLEKFNTLLYAIPKEAGLTDSQNSDRQKSFFLHIYQLLFGTKAGPRLGPFLWDADHVEILRLLDV